MTPNLRKRREEDEESERPCSTDESFAIHQKAVKLRLLHLTTDSKKSVTIGPVTTLHAISHDTTAVLFLPALPVESIRVLELGVDVSVKPVIPARCKHSRKSRVAPVHVMSRTRRVVLCPMVA